MTRWSGLVISFLAWQRKGKDEEKGGKEKLTIFEKPADYEAFLQALDETWQIIPLPIFAMVAMPNHWHFVVRSTTDDQVSEFLRRLTVMHTTRDGQGPTRSPKDSEDPRGQYH